MESFLSRGYIMKKIMETKNQLAYIQQGKVEYVYVAFSA